MQKITIQPLDDNFGSHGKSIDGGYYNPNEYTIETKNQYHRTAMPGLSSPVTQFINGEAQTVSLSLFFDTYEQRRDVREYTGKVVKLLEIDPELHHPPVCEFTWGKALSTIRDKFRGVIDSCSQKYTMFLDDGTPVRATLTLSVSEYRTVKEQLQSLKLSSPDRTKYRMFVEGDALWRMSFREYNDPKSWRRIAEENGIDFPRIIRPGTPLAVPPLEEK
jgi:nucleoid-associated protein YgaU